ncbi:MAG: hypothetical protein GOMPHAMPRED_005920 [Gomphillus americanus]|uniref:Ribosomal protein S21 n=1 Tax=Gomphillus americanus TaxID=1940652 RepID=A0A8H3ITJ2_9LECA|nr:MAG: hypothetical protein GOMPHAMPRED_005920 [Gomphillus americanus]
MKLHRLCNALTYHQHTSHSVLFSTPSRRAIIPKTRSWIIHPQTRSLSLSQTLHIPQAATQEARIPSNTLPDDKEATTEKPSRLDGKHRLREESQEDKLPSERQLIDDSLSRPALPAEPRSPWGAPVPRRRMTAHSAAVADLMKSTTRAAERSSSSTISTNSSSSSASSSASTFGAPRRQPVTPTARRQEDLANVIGGTVQGGLHARLEAPLPMRMDPFMGRAVVVNRTAQPLARALGLLNTVLKSNMVRKQVNMQKFHERPGLKRKRLKSERWRQRFMVSFRHVVGKVRQMKSQGW